MKLLTKAGIGLLSMTLCVMPTTIHAQEEVTVGAPVIKKIDLVGMNISKITFTTSSDVDGYEIMRKTSPSGTWKTIGSMEVNSQSFAYDGNIKKGTYYYAIKAYKKEGSQKIYSNVDEQVYKKTYKNVTKNLFKGGSYKKGSAYGPSLSTKQLSQVKNAVRSFVNNYITSDMTTVEKLYIAQSYMASHCTYASSWAKNQANNAYGALVYKNKKGIHEAQCSGYARGFKALCDGMGIGCQYVHANKKSANPSHQWNEVKVAGKWYIIDSQANASSGFLALFLCGKKTYSSTGMKWDTKKYHTVSNSDYASNTIRTAVNGYRCFYMTDTM